MNLKIIY